MHRKWRVLRKSWFSIDKPLFNLCRKSGCDISKVSSPAQIEGNSTLHQMPSLKLVDNQQLVNRCAPPSRPPGLNFSSQYFPSSYPMVTQSGSSPISPGSQWSTAMNTNYGSTGSNLPPFPSQHRQEFEEYPLSLADQYMQNQGLQSSRESIDVSTDMLAMQGPGYTTRPHSKGSSPRRSSNRDEFDGPHQFLSKPSSDVVAAQDRDLPHVPTNLYVQEQDDVLSKVNDRLSQCAFDFVAKYQFPIPLEKDKRPVQIPSDREWTEWVFLLKRLATKRRIPARILYNGQIKQLVTVLENSLEMRHAAKHQSRPLKDDRNVLQLISAGLQVAKILKDASCMDFMDKLYLQTEKTIQARRTKPGYLS